MWPAGLVAVVVTLVLPEAFPEKYREAVVRVAEQCSVKKAIAAQPAPRLVALGAEKAAVEADRGARRRDRPGDQMQAAKGWLQAELAVAAPGFLRHGSERWPALRGWGRRLAAAAEQQTGFLEGFAQGGPGQGSQVTAREAVQARCRCWDGLGEAAGRPVPGLQPAAGKDIDVGHEAHVGIAPPPQNLAPRAAAAQQHQAGRRSGPDRPPARRSAAHCATGRSAVSALWPRIWA